MDHDSTPDEAKGERPVSPRTTPAPAPRLGNAKGPEPVPAQPVAPHAHLEPPQEARAPLAADTVPTNIYRARRPAAAVFLILPALAVSLLLVRALAISAFGRPFLIGGVIASSLALASLPLLVAGLYGLITGAAHGAEQWGFRVWARPPLAYLIVGIAFVIGAGLAIS